MLQTDARLQANQAPKRADGLASPHGGNKTTA
jgi:hypothetical protein